MNRKQRIFFLFLFLTTSLISYSQFKSTIARKTVLFEIGTGVGCANCTSVTEAMDSLVLNGKDVSVIKYHWADQFESEDGYNRVGYYDITANPTTMVDGKERIVGGGYQMNLYPEFLAKYEEYIVQESTMEMEMEVSQLEGRNYRLNISVEQLEFLYDTKLNLRIALIESHIEHDWFYLNEVNFVCRDMIKNDKGYKLDFTEDSVNNFELFYEIDTVYNISNCNIIAFVQHDGSMEILQALKASIPFEGVSINEKNRVNGLRIFPNPVKDKLFIKNAEMADKIEVRTITGQLIYSGNNVKMFETGYDMNDRSNGVYIVTLNFNNEIRIERFIKQ